ncbi:MAG: flagellar hook-associated protein FlgK [Sphingomonadales bacterium]
MVTVLSSVLNTALTGLNANQQALRTTSNNIANVNTPGYVREVVRFEHKVGTGQTAGVQIGDVQRVVDVFLENAARAAISDTERFASETQMHDRLQTLLGRPDENTSLSGRLDDVFTGIASLTLDPAAPARRQTALSSIEDFADEVSRLSEQFQVLRADASSRIVEDVVKLNSLLKNIAELNPIIVRENALGLDIGGLQEQRDRSLREIAELIDVRINNNADGSIRVTTGTGVTLLDETRFEVRFNPPGTVLPETNFEQITIHKIDPVTGVVDPNSRILDTAIDSGSLRGLLDVRDKVIPDLAISLGELSAGVIDQLNSAHNANTAVPAPNSMTGRNVGILGTDSHGFTGDATFAVLAPDGTLVNSFTVDFDALAATDSIDTVIANVNAGLGGAATLSLTNGVMTFSATSAANGIAIVQDENDPSSRAGRGFAHFFGMNDLLGAQVSPHFETGFSTTSAHGFVAGGTIDLDLRGSDGVVVANYTLTIGGSTFDDLLTDLNQPGNLGAFASFSMDAKGALVVSPKAGLSDLKLTVNSDSTLRGGTGVALSNLLGIGDSFRMNAARGVKLSDAIAKNMERLALGRVDLTVPAGAPAINRGDTRGAVALQDLTQKPVSFKAAGQLAAVTTTLGRFAANVLSNAALMAERADDLKENSDALQSEIVNRISNVSGVNMDEELANMVVFQNAFNASARLISTAQEMFDTLLDAVR